MCRVLRCSVYSVVLCVCVYMRHNTQKYGLYFRNRVRITFLLSHRIWWWHPARQSFFFASNIKFSKNYFLSRNEGAVCSRGMNTSLRCLLVPPSEIVFLSRHFLNRVIYVNSITQYIIEVAFLFFLSMGNDKISICFFFKCVRTIYEWWRKKTMWWFVYIRCVSHFGDEKDHVARSKHY